jgi:hypothetical protein
MLSYKQFLNESKTLNIVGTIELSEYLKLKKVPEKLSSVELAIIVSRESSQAKLRSPIFPSALFINLTDDGYRDVSKDSFVGHYSSIGMNTLIVSDTLDKANAYAVYLIKKNLASGKISTFVNNDTLSGLLSGK